MMTDPSPSPEREAQLRILLVQTPAVIWTTDRDLRYTSTEGAGLAALRLTPGELIGKSVAHTGEEGSAAAEIVLQAHRRALAGENVTYHLQWGDAFFEGHVQPLRGASGQIEGCIGVALDISERLRSYQLLERRVDERTRELSWLLAFSRQAAATLDVSALTDLVVDEVTRLVDTTETALFMLDGDVLKVVAQRGRDRDTAPEEVRIALDEAGRAFLNRDDPAPVVHSDLASGGDASAQRGAAIRCVAGRWLDQTHGLRSIMWVPMAAKNTVTGGLCVAHAEPGKYSERDAALIQAVASQAAVAIENARLYEQARELAVLQERQRLARDLHDSVTQSLYSLTLMAEAARRLVNAGNIERGGGYLARIGESAQQLLKEMRLLVYELRPLILERDGLAAALKQRLETVENRTGVETSLVVEGSGLVPELIEVELFRIAQEALNNSLKHSGASSVLVRLNTAPAEVTLAISDNGRGFIPGAVGDKGGLGLVSMKERTHRLGGRLDIESGPGAGASITVCIPIPGAGEK